MVMIEAMAKGTPVVALRRGSVPEVVLHGRTGLVCADESELPEALLDAGRLDPADCAAHVRTSFSVELMAHRYERVYRRLIGAQDRGTQVVGRRRRARALLSSLLCSLPRNGCHRCRCGRARGPTTSAPSARTRSRSPRSAVTTTVRRSVRPPRTRSTMASSPEPAAATTETVSGSVPPPPGGPRPRPRAPHRAAWSGLRPRRRAPATPRPRVRPAVVGWPRRGRATTRSAPNRPRWRRRQPPAVPCAHPATSPPTPGPYSLISRGTAMISHPLSPSLR